VSPANESSDASDGQRPQSPPSATQLGVNQGNATHRSDSGISSVDLDELVVKDIRIKPPVESVMVEEDYVVPSPSLDEKLEPWEMSMAQAWEAAVADRNDEVFHSPSPRSDVEEEAEGGDELEVEEAAWRTKAPSTWSNEDIVQWCECKQFPALADLLSGNAFYGNA
jgi:hypothetical protein